MFTNCGPVLVLAPHTDDGEFGCGGTIAKLVSQGRPVYYVAFSDCEKSIPPGFPPDALARETREATRELGIPAENVQIKKFEVRCFERDRQDVLEDMVKIARAVDPDIVLVPSPGDIHQDHATIALEGMRAFKLRSTILGYEMPWNNMSFSTTCFVTLEEAHLNKKIRALQCYKSQWGRHYMTEEFIRSLAITRGTQIGIRYAETFEVLRLIVR